MALWQPASPGLGHSPLSVGVDDDGQVVHDSNVHKLFGIVNNAVDSFNIQDSVLGAEEFR